jgi:hypothetical protein
VLANDECQLTFGTPGSTDPMAFHGYMYATWQKSLTISSLSTGTLLDALISESVSEWLSYWSLSGSNHHSVLVGFGSRDLAAPSGIPSLLCHEKEPR